MNKYFGNKKELGNENKFGSLNTFGDGNKLGDFNKLGNLNTFGDGNKFGNENKFGDFNMFGYGNELGDNCTLGKSNRFGNRFKFGKRLTIEGVKCRDLMTMDNIDGNWVQIQIIIHTEGIKIRAGCFSGSLDEFCAQAESNNHITRSKVVRATAKAFEQCLNEQGITGGWDEE